MRILEIKLERNWDFEICSRIGDLQIKFESRISEELDFNN